MPMLIYFFPKREIWQVHPKKTDSTWGSVTSDFWTLMQHLEIPRRRKFYQGPGLKHTSDIFHVLKTKLYHSFQSPHGGSAWCLQKNKQTNDRVSNIGTYFSCVFVFSFMNYNHRYSWNYFLLLDFFYLNFRDNLLELRIYFESLTYSDVRQVPSYDLYSLLGRKLFISFLLLYIYIFALFTAATFLTFHKLSYITLLTVHHLQYNTYNELLRWISHSCNTTMLKHLIFLNLPAPFPHPCSLSACDQLVVTTKLCMYGRNPALIAS